MAAVFVRFLVTFCSFLTAAVPTAAVYEAALSRIAVGGLCTRLEVMIMNDGVFATPSAAYEHARCIPGLAAYGL
jgi:hypothetical protein